MKNRLLAAILLLCTWAHALSAQAPAATAPTTTPANLSAPTTGPTTRRAVAVPPGFHALTIRNCAVLCQDADDAWVRQALESRKPSSRPSTMPSDLLQRLAEQRAGIIQHLTADLALPDDTAVTRFLDQDLAPLLHQRKELHPALVFLVCTNDKINSLVRDGWQDPLFYYNRVADKAAYYGDRVLHLAERSPDDIVILAIYQEGMSAQQRSAELTGIIQGTEFVVTDAIASRSEVLLQEHFIPFIIKDVMKPLNLQLDQQWFGIGIAGVLSGKYAAPIMGISVADLDDYLTWEPARIPVKAAPIDLLHLTPVSDLRPQYVPWYLEAVRRKSMKVIDHWIAGGKDSYIPQTLAAIRKSPPADGPALLKLIQETTGVDLTKDLQAQ